jgi:hypothetical protein
MSVTTTKMNTGATHLKQKLTEPLKESTIHGLPHILKSKNYALKTLWMVLMLVSFCYGSYLIIQEVNSYLAHPVNSLTRVNCGKSVDLPIITVCNMNPFATEFAKNSVSELEQNHLFDNSTNSTSTNILNYLIGSYYASGNAWEKLNETSRKKFGLSFNQTIISCIFNWADCTNDAEFEEFYDIFYGNCLRFNREMTKKVIFSGSMNGLKLQLLSNSLDGNNSLFSMYTGFTIYISDQPRINSFFTDGIKVPVGSLTDIVVNKVVISKQPKPYSECVSDLSRIDSYPSQIYKKTFTLNKNSYSLSDCINLCYQVGIIDLCGCYEIGSGLSPDPQARPCLNETDQLCDSFFTSNFTDTCDCPMPCSGSMYDVITSSAGFPTQAYSDFLLSDPGFRARFWIPL